MLQRKLLAAACFAFMATQAHAADNCYIREYAAIGQALTVPAQIASEPGITDQVTADFTSAAVQSSAFNAQTTFIRLWCNAQASILFGTNPTAANTNAPIAANTPEYFAVPVNQGYKISVHTNP